MSRTINISFLLLLVSSLSCIRVDDKQPRILRIAETEFNNVPIGNILAESEFTQLEFTPESALPEYAPFLNSTNNYFLADQFQKKVIFQFDQSGRFVRTIGKFGHGPGEYPQIIDAIITGQGPEILSGGNTTDIYRYNSDGQLLQKVSVPIPFGYSFAQLPGSGDYCVFSGFSQHLIHRFKRESLAPVDSFLLRNQNLMVPAVQAFGITTIGSVLFYQPYDNRIFSLEKDTIHLRYILDTGSTMPSYDAMVQADQQKLFGEGVLWLVYRALENKDWLYLLLSKQDFTNPAGSDFYSLLFNKKTGKLFRLPENPEPGPLFLPAFGLTGDNVLYTAVSPAYVHDSDAWKTGLAKKGIQPNPDGNYIIIKYHLSALNK